MDQSGGETSRRTVPELPHVSGEVPRRGDRALLPCRVLIVPHRSSSRNGVPFRHACWRRRATSPFTWGGLVTRRGEVDLSGFIELVRQLPRRPCFPTVARLESSIRAVPSRRRRDNFASGKVTL